MVDAPEQVPIAAAPGPGVDLVLEVPPVGENGGEFALLLAKLKAWWLSGEPQDLWQRLRKPLGGGVTLLVVLLVLQVYVAFVQTLDSLPLLPGLLELVGLVWLVRVAGPRLLRRSDRQQLFADLAGRWQRFRGSS